jgi:FkbM family methyltransferase
VNPADKTLRDSLLLFGTHENYETLALINCLRPGMTFIDVGANIGYYTVVAASKVGENGRVFAYEPDPVNYSFLERSVKANNFRNVSLIRQALSDEAGFATFFLSDHLGSHSLAAQDTCTRTTTVELTRLDDDAGLIEGGVHVMKMDAQGAEYKIMRGGINLLRRWMPVIMLEFEPKCLQTMGTSPEEFARLFDDLGYEITLLDGEKRQSFQTSSAELLEISRQHPHLNLLLKKRS